MNESPFETLTNWFLIKNMLSSPESNPSSRQKDPFVYRWKTCYDTPSGQTLYIPWHMLSLQDESRPEHTTGNQACLWYMGVFGVGVNVRAPNFLRIARSPKLTAVWPLFFKLKSRFPVEKEKENFWPVCSLHMAIATVTCWYMSDVLHHCSPRF